MREYGRKTLENGNDLVAVKGSTNGKWRRPMISLVEVPRGQEVKTTDLRRIIRLHDQGTASSDHIGPRSSFYRIFVRIVGQVRDDAQEWIDRVIEDRKAYQDWYKWITTQPGPEASAHERLEWELARETWVAKNNEWVVKTFL